MDQADSGRVVEREKKACGVLVFRRKPQTSFLLMKHADRLDLPKGHVEPGENEVDSALRELREETGIRAQDIQLDPDFRFTTTYDIPLKRDPNKVKRKTVVIFLGWLAREVPIRLTEHVGYEWVPWNPPHLLQSRTIDPLLGEVAKHLSGELRAGG